jgi:hypothetical protein
MYFRKNGQGNLNIDSGRRRVMKAKKNLFGIGLFVLCVVIIAGGAMKLFGAEEKTYEIHPEIALGPYQTDTMHVMGAYERLMERYMNLVEVNLQEMSRGNQQTVKKLESIEKKLDALGMRMGRIEKALRIEPVKTSRTKSPAKPEAPEK